MILTRPNILEEATDAPRIKLILLKFTFTFPFPQLVRYTPVLPGNIYLEIAFPDKSEGEGTYQVYRAIKFIATTKRDAFRLLRFPITDGYARISRRSRNSISSSVDSLDPVRFREIDRFREAGGARGFLGPDHPDPRFLVLRLLRGALFVQLPIYRSASLAPSCASWREHWTAFFLRPP